MGVDMTTQSRNKREGSYLNRAETRRNMRRGKLLPKDGMWAPMAKRTYIWGSLDTARKFNGSLMVRRGWLLANKQWVIAQLYWDKSRSAFVCVDYPNNRIKRRTTVVPRGTTWREALAWMTAVLALENSHG